MDIQFLHDLLELLLFRKIKFALMFLLNKKFKIFFIEKFLKILVFDMLANSFGEK